MIKAGILGADTPEGGELLRLLVQHPEIDSIQPCFPAKAGSRVSDHHYGLIGEPEVRFVASLDVNEPDLLFLCGEQGSAFDKWDQHDDLRIIDLSAGASLRMEEHGAELGLSEVNRKPLVRGARRAAIPASEVAVAMIALYPLASHLMLNGALKVGVKSSRPPRQNWTEELAERLKGVQESFSGRIEAKCESCVPVETPSFFEMTLEVPTNIDLSEILPLYDGIYDDHNFTFFLTRPVDYREVAGTHKCILSLSKPDPATLRIQAVADPKMRGGASEAVHVMNLFFALQEQTGLNLKAIY